MMSPGPFPSAYEESGDGYGGQIHLSRFDLELDGIVMSITVPNTSDGRQLAEAWLAKWTREIVPHFLPSTLYRLRVQHG